MAAARTGFDWRQFAILLAAAAAGVAAALPYAFTVFAARIARVPWPRAALAAAQLAQAVLLAALAAAAGLRLGPRVGLGAPLLARALHGPAGAAAAAGRDLLRFAALAVPLGAAAGALAAALDRAAFASALPAALREARAPVWQGLLAALYGGVTEEVLLRFGLFTALAWGLMRLWARAAAPGPGLTPLGGWTANVLTAVAFALLHLPAMAALAPLDARLVARTLVLNGGPGLLFGWLYWSRGLEAAMLAHVSADVALRAAAALLAP